MSQGFFELELQHFLKEIRSVVQSEAEKIRKRLDCIERRSSRSKLSYDSFRRNLWHDSYPPRNSNRNKDHHEFEAFRGNKRKGTSTSSSAPKYSSMEVQSRKGDRVSFENHFAHTRQKSIHSNFFISTTSCKERMS